MKKTLTIVLGIVVIAGFVTACKPAKQKIPIPATNFEECVKAGNPVMESYPRQCRDGDRTFTENIGNEFDKTDLIRIDAPRPNQLIQSPLTITGEARGSWFFEASFPIDLTNWDGLIVAQGFASAKGDWMTTEFVPFEAELTFTVDKNATGNKGTLILRKANPSGLPEHEDSLEVPVVFSGIVGGATPSPKACTQEAKLCPDGSSVGRTGPNCEFAQCPALNPEPVSGCKKDSDCPSSQYVCQEIQGMGTACSSADPNCVPTHTIIQGECKLKEGNGCSVDSDCVAGNRCQKNSCVSPIGKQCSGPEDTTCPADFECVEGCGPPVVRFPDNTPPSYFCQLKGTIRNCPICLSKDTLIDTPQGEIPVQEMHKGMPVWTVTASGKRARGVVIETGKTPVPADHQMVELVLDDGRALLVSPGHPTVDGRSVGDLVAGDRYEGARIATSKRVPYGNEATYDILPSGETGFYWANGIPLGSTLH